MDKIEQTLRDNYEDAMFALLMDGYAKEEGKHLLDLANQLNSDNEYVLPADMEKNGVKTIQKAFRRKNILTFAKVSGKAFSKVAILVLILNIAFGISFFSVEAFRAEVLDIMIDYQSTHTTVKFIDGSSSDYDEHTAQKFMQVLPGSYKLTSYEYEDGSEYAIITDSAGIQIIWSVESTNATINLDTEDAEFTENISFGNIEGILVEKNDNWNVVLGDTVANKVYYISTNADKDLLMRWLYDFFS